MRVLCFVKQLYQSSWSLWMILELVDGGDLRSFLAKNRPLYTEAMGATHMKQIMSGIHYLHSKGVIHRDLKLENILLKRQGDDNYIAKIADFGLSALVRIGEDGYHTSKSSKRKEYDGLHEPWGTAEYEAPEILNGAYGPQVDMWAMGCMLYEILSGTKAFRRNEDERNFHGMHERIRRGEFDMKK
jgi:serine/threonine protein kinase